MIWVFVCFALLASAMSVNKIILQSVPLAFFVGARMLVAGMILCALYHKKLSRFSWGKIKAIAPNLFTIAMCTTFIPSLLKAYSFKYLLSSKAAFIGSLDPFVTAIYAYILINERLSLQKIIGITISFAGSILLCIPHSSLEKTTTEFLVFSLPELAAFGSVIISRYGWISAQKILKKDHFSPPELNGIIMTISGIAALSRAFSLDAHVLSTIQPTIQLCCLFAYTVLVGNVLAYTMYGYLLKNHSANFVSLAGFSVPIFVSLYGFLLLNEPITLTLIVSASIIFLGGYIFYRDGA